MQLFQMKDHLNEVNVMKMYLEENFVSFGWRDVGSLENVSEAQFRSTSLHNVDRAQSAWLSQLEEINTFVYVMQDGDYIVMESDGYIYVGDVGDYYYVADLDGESNHSHRRGVTWLKSVPMEQLTEELRLFVCQRDKVSMFHRSISVEMMENWLTSRDHHEAGDHKASAVDEQTIEEALLILKNAMRSGDIERSERAAIAILQYAK